MKSDTFHDLQANTMNTNIVIVNNKTPWFFSKKTH